MYPLERPRSGHGRIRDLVNSAAAMLAPPRQAALAFVIADAVGAIAVAARTAYRRSVSEKET